MLPAVFLASISVVPLPRQVTSAAGTYEVPSGVHIAATGEAANSAEFLAAFLASRGMHATVVRSGSAEVRLSLTHDPAIHKPDGYRLAVDATGVSIEANSGSGLFYGVQTLEQLFNVGSPPSSDIPYVRIADWPEYRWRGIHLDVSRHFFPVPVVEQYIDLAARYKLNVFHWHLTDDQGWRIEIKRYPRLTSVGGCRSGTQVGGEGETATDGQRYCGYYTQAQIRAVVAYARKRYVTIVPEIEMPGHAAAAITAYPWLGCTGRQYGVRELWGVSTQIYCPTERTFGFINNVLAEVAALFPGEYIHIGGDEVPKDAWMASPFVTELKKREHLDSYAAVQGYFTRRVEAIAARYHRRVVGWDEILDGGVSRSAVVMSWRGTEGGTIAAKRGNDVVMSPDGVLYLDANQGNSDLEPLSIGGLTTLQMVYDYDPRPPGLTASQAEHILGAQANLWTEYVPTAKHLFYMLLPRELALSELAWTPSSEMNWNDFTERLGPQLQRLYNEAVPFRIPDVTYRVDATGVQFPEQQAVQSHTSVSIRDTSAVLTLVEPATFAAIHYTVDGSAPSAQSPVYAGPLHLTVGATPTQIGAIAVLPDGRIGTPSYFEITAR